ncbi:unnamed protein product [Cyprideis torosa]|uniref:Uncharacterized protein n=1 Tax=Cyprideis torosa TaxID=163714 RepID=A0A7R8W2G6_9CRUS|nr:unnamed protein product [Cyprideis torosa]CAG0881850.1 unnamed protein product [Cyprideis torosa]
MQFSEAAEKVKKLKQTPTDDEMLELYGLYKQATVGDVNTQRPGMLDLKGKAKWDRWESKKGLTTGQAEKNYVVLAEELISKYGMEA